EPVNAGALALLWLVGALHLAVAGARPSSALVRKPRGQAPRRSSIGVHARAPPGRAARRSALGAPRACARRATCLRSPRHVLALAPRDRQHERRRFFSPIACTPGLSRRALTYSRPTGPSGPLRMKAGQLSGEERIGATVNDELEHIWSRVQAELARSVEESTYRIWLQPLQPRELSGGCLLVEAPADACGWICDRFGRLLQASATLVLGV